MTKNSIDRRYFWFLFIFLALAVLPWLGLTDFNTRGEPREAIVSQTMLDQGNWILPNNNGGEMAYKPPFYHWCGAVVASLTGHVNEYTARFPSAASGIALVLWTFVFYARRKDSYTALLTALIMFSCFEVHRACFAARVDMVLTFCIVGSLFTLAHWAEEKRPWWCLPWLGILLMSLGALTKGPVAIVLPCAVTGLFLLLKKRGIIFAFSTMAISCILSIILPILWYWAAYQQGGEEFLQLVKEENLDRFLGKMSYASHEHGILYYPMMLLAGLLPWSLIFLWQGWLKRTCINKLAYLKERIALLWKRIQSMDTTSLFSLIAFVLIFVFYCIPKSKRGVYILPVYPFAAWYIANIIRGWNTVLLRRIFMIVISLWCITDIIALPLILNAKSDRDIAQDITALIGDKPLISHVSGGAPGNPMHYFTINFYMNNRVGVWDKDQDPESDGYLLIGEGDAQDFLIQHSGYSFEKVYSSSHKSCDTRQKVNLFKFERIN